MSGTIKFLDKLKVSKGEYVMVKVSTMHDIGTGILISEIYRKSGNKRELHVDKVLGVVNTKKASS